MQINIFTIDEYDDLLTLWERCGLSYEENGRDSRERVEQQIYDDHIVILTLKTDEGKLIGSIIGSYDGRKAWINRLAVHPDYRDAGWREADRGGRGQIDGNGRHHIRGAYRRPEFSLDGCVQTLRIRRSGRHHLFQKKVEIIASSS